MKIEWRPNNRVSGQDAEFIDLFIDNFYASVWVERARNTGKWIFVAYSQGYKSPEFDTMEEAQAHLTTYNVILKLEA